MLNGRSLLVPLFSTKLGRFPKSGAKIDLPAVFRQAKEVASWVDGIERIVPREQWSAKLIGYVFVPRRCPCASWSLLDTDFGLDACLVSYRLMALRLLATVNLM